MKTKSEQVLYLIDTYGKDDQRTEAWHLKRGEMLTASEISKAMKDATPSARHELIMNKLTPREKGFQIIAGALIWGTRFESIAKEIYCHLNTVKIADTTCVPHPKQPFLGASPDGILVCEDINDSKHGRLVEFKCPISRVYDEKNPIPITYYHQMQLQMECTELDECDYVEFRFKKLNYSEWMDSKKDFKSVFAVNQNGDITYKLITDKRELSEWKKDIVDIENCQYIYWELSTIISNLVSRDPLWLETHLPSFQEVWNEIRQYRQTATFPEHPKEKTTLLL